MSRLPKNCPIVEQVFVAPAEEPPFPWQRFRVDFAGNMQGKMVMAMVDAHTKWPEVVQMEKTTAKETANKLRTITARYEFPEQVVTDNDPSLLRNPSRPSWRGMKYVM
jgi:hypothetical protein